MNRIMGGIGVPRSILRSMPGSVRIIFFDNAGFFFDDFGLGTGSGHGRTEDHVDDQHNNEEVSDSAA